MQLDRCYDQRKANVHPKTPFYLTVTRSKLLRSFVFLNSKYPAQSDLKLYKILAACSNHQGELPAYRLLHFELNVQHYAVSSQASSRGGTLTNILFRTVFNISIKGYVADSVIFYGRNSSHAGLFFPQNKIHYFKSVGSTMVLKGYSNLDRQELWQWGMESWPRMHHYLSSLLWAF